MDNINDLDLQLIDKHLMNTLSQEEALLFNKRIQHPEFQQQLELMQTLKEGIDHRELKNIKNILQEEERNIQAGNQKKDILEKPKFSRFSFLLRIAALIIGLSLLIGWWISQPKNNTAYLYTQYFKPVKNTLVNTQRSNPDISRKLEIFKAYDNGQYKEALEGFDELLAVEDNNDYRFYKANALLALGKTDQAIVIFEALLSKQQSQFLDESKWLLALSYLRLNKKEEAHLLLEMLLDHPFYKSNATIILAEID